jgi:hypothetical protein
VKLLLELAARHRRVLFALEVGEDAGAGVRAERVGADEHAGLHHQLRYADATQEGGFATLVGAGDDDELLAVGVDVVADDLRVEVEGERDVVELAR